MTIAGVKKEVSVKKYSLAYTEAMLSAYDNATEHSTSDIDFDLLEHAFTNVPYGTALREGEFSKSTIGASQYVNLGFPTGTLSVEYQYGKWYLRLDGTDNLANVLRSKYLPPNRNWKRKSFDHLDLVSILKLAIGTPEYWQHNGALIDHVLSLYTSYTENLDFLDGAIEHLIGHLDILNNNIQMIKHSSKYTEFLFLKDTTAATRIAKINGYYTNFDPRNPHDYYPELSADNIYDILYHCGINDVVFVETLDV